MFAGFAARGRSSLNCRELHWTAPGKLAAVQPSPWLYSGSYRPTQKKEKGRTTKNSTTGGERDVPRKGGKAWDSATKKNKQIQRARTRNNRGQQSVRNIRNLCTRTMGRQSYHHTDTKPTEPRKENGATNQPKTQKNSRGRTNTQTPEHNKAKEGGEGSREAAQDRGRKGTQEPEGVLECLNRRPMGVLDHRRWIPQWGSAEHSNNAHTVV